MSSRRIKRIKKVFIASGVLSVIFIVGSIISGLYIRANSIHLECKVEGEEREFILRGDELITGIAVFNCQVKGGERLCGPLTSGKTAVYLYVLPDFSAMYFAPEIEGEVKKERCHAFQLGYSPRFNMCVSLSNKIECRRKRGK